MNDQPIRDIDDVAQAIRENRPLHPAREYKIEIAVDGAEFHAARLPDARPLGRQIVAAAALDPQTDPSLFALLASGDFEEVLLDAPFDLRARAAERFIAFTGDRDFKLTLNGAQVRWGLPTVSGHELCVLAHAPAEDAAFLVSAGEKRRIEPGERVDLTHDGVEHFVTAPREENYDIVVNGHELVVHRSRQAFSDLVALAYPNQPPAPNVIYSITYRHAASDPHSGELGMGGAIHVKNGTIINVGRTVQS